MGNLFDAIAVRIKNALEGQDFVTCIVSYGTDELFMSNIVKVNECYIDDCDLFIYGDNSLELHIDTDKTVVEYDKMEDCFTFKNGSIEFTFVIVDSNIDGYLSSEDDLEMNVW